MKRHSIARLEPVHDSGVGGSDACSPRIAKRCPHERFPSGDAAST
jgi:hypothetical protein